VKNLAKTAKLLFLGIYMSLAALDATVPTHSFQLARLDFNPLMPYYAQQSSFSPKQFAMLKQVTLKNLAGSAAASFCRKTPTNKFAKIPL